jgi:hypothetical protein
MLVHWRFEGGSNKALEKGTYPVNLIKGVRLEDNAGDDTNTGGNLNLYFELAKEDVLGAVDGRGLLFICNAEDGALGLVVLEGGASGEVKERIRALGEIDINLASECWVRRAV